MQNETNQNIVNSKLKAADGSIQESRLSNLLKRELNRPTSSQTPMLHKNLMRDLIISQNEEEGNQLGSNYQRVLDKYRPVTPSHLPLVYTCHL